MPRRTLSVFTVSTTALLLLAGVANADTSAPFSLDSPATQAYTNNARPDVRFSGAAPEATVTLATNGLDEGAWTDIGHHDADSDGNGVIHPSADIADAPDQHVSLSLTDGDGQWSSSTVHFDTVPHLSGPADDYSVPASQVSYLVSGAIPEEGVTLYVDGHEAATAKADEAGTIWSLAPDAALTAGPHTIAASTTDADGVEGDQSAERTVNVRPAVPAFASTFFSGMQFNQSRPDVVINGVDPHASKVTLYEILPDEEGYGTPVSVGDDTDTEDIASGTVTIKPNLSDGDHSFVVAQTVDGLESDTNTGDVILTTVNTKAPVLADIDALTNRARPWFSASDLLYKRGDQSTSKVVLFVDGQNAGQMDDFGGDQVSFKPSGSLTEGAHSAYVVTVDDLGHVSAEHSNTVNFTVDTIAPEVSTVSPEDGATVTTATPHIVVHTEPGADVTLFIEDTQDGARLTADGAGNATFTPHEALVDGIHTLYMHASDAAGNDSDVRATPTKPQPPVNPTDTDADGIRNDWLVNGKPVAAPAKPTLGKVTGVSVAIKLPKAPKGSTLVVYVGTGNGKFSQAKGKLNGKGELTVTGLKKNTAYEVKVVKVNKAGKQSAASKPLKVKTKKK